MSRLRIFLSCVGAIGLVCVTFLCFQVSQKPESKETAENHEQPTKHAPTSVADLNSSTKRRNESPEGTSSILLPDSHQSVAPSEFGSSTPDLSSIEITDFRGELKKGKLPQRPTVDLSIHPSLEWFTKEASAISFPDTPESLNRDYFYSWVQLNPNFLHKVTNDSFRNFEVELLKGWSEYRRARLPRSPDLLEQLLKHEAVFALGTKPISEKIAPNFRDEIESSDSSGTKEVFITLMTTVEVTRWQNEIKNTGAVIDHWDPTIRVLVASMPYGKILEVAEWDFVQAIEPVSTVKLMLDSAVPVAGADGLRTHLSRNGRFRGITGEGITVGVMDTGLNLSHPDIYTGRESVCGESFMALLNGQLDTDDLWVDQNGHGTHVTSIAVGLGVDVRSRAGIAPGVEHLRIAKVFSQDLEYASTSAVLQAMDYFTEESSCEWEDSESAEKRPHLVNMSLGATTSDAGYGITVKKLDWAVWNYKQVYVVAQGNDADLGYNGYSSAKNSISVAWLTDALFADYWSSLGPTSDGRMIPSVGISGDVVYAADGYGSTHGYALKNGTSMASPAVAGVVALLMSADSNFEDNPALVRAQLMATAIKPDAYFDDEAYAPRSNTNGTGSVNNQHGLGAVSARTAITQGPNGEWSSHSAVSEMKNDEYAYIEIDIPENTDRLDIVLTWDEPQNDHVGDAVMADLDLYLGPDRNCDVLECGDFVSSSRVDNLEYLIIDKPNAGKKRITVIPHNVYQFAPRIAVSWVFIKTATPQLNIELSTDELEAKKVRRPRLDVTVTTDEYVAAGVSMFFTCREQNDGDCDYWDEDSYSWEEGSDSRWQPGSRVTREDGTVQDLTGLPISSPVMLGEVVSGESQRVRLVFPPDIKTGNHQLYVSVASANALSDSDSVDVLVDSEDLPARVKAIQNSYAINAIELSGDSGSVVLDLAGGARSSGELLIDTTLIEYLEVARVSLSSERTEFKEGYAQSRSAWYKLRVDKASMYDVQVTSIEPSLTNVVFQFLRHDKMFEPHRAHVWNSDEYKFYLQPDIDYYLRVSTYEPMDVPEVQFVWEKLDTKPANDDFDDRTSVSGNRGSIKGNNAFATVELGEPGGHLSVATTWFTWRAPADGVWNFRAEASFVTDTPQVYVYYGTSLDDLRLMSDPVYYDADVPVVRGHEYQVCVSSGRRFTDFQGSYELTWEESYDFVLADNDMFEDAHSISGEQGLEDDIPGGVRTVELNEPDETESRSIWWKWDAPKTDQFTFRVTESEFESLSVYRGTEIDELTFEHVGTEFILDANADETYYIVLHRKSGLRYYSDDKYVRGAGNSFVWGPTPSYDRINSPLTLTGTSGSNTFDLTYATTTTDETATNGLQSVGVHSSVWATWIAPSSFDGWMMFSSEFWEDAELEEAEQQYYLGIHERDEANNRWNLVASTDRSYIISGKPHAIFKPDGGKEYRVQVARRTEFSAFSPYSNDPVEVEISWEQTGPPSWLTNNLNYHEIGSPTGNDIEELIDPRAGTVAGRDLDLLVLAVEDNLLVLEFKGSDDDLEVVETIPYEDDDGEEIEIPDRPVWVWHPDRRSIYIAQDEGFIVFQGLEQSNRAFSECTVSDDYDVDPLQVITEDTGRYLYKVGSNTIATYRIDGPCELSLVQVLTSSYSSHSLVTRDSSLSGLRSVSFGPSQTYMYGVSDDELLTFERDKGTGELSVASDPLLSSLLREVGIASFDASRFDRANVVVDSRGDYLIAVGTRNPAIVIFDLSSDREEPSPIAALVEYYITGSSSFFPSHIRRPWYWDEGQCQIKSVHNTDNPTVEVFCRYMYFVATYDRETEDFYLSDWSSNEQPDRFGYVLPALNSMDDSFSVSTTNGKYSYLVVDDWLDSIHRFERITGANTITTTASATPYDEYLVQLVAMDVAPNEIKIGSQSFRSCTPIENEELDDVTYTVLRSKWQVRQNLGEAWTDVGGTVRSDNQLCPLDPTDGNDHRLVFEVTIDGVRDKFTSDVMSKRPLTD